MIEKADVEVLLDAVAEAVKEFVNQRDATLKAEIEKVAAENRSLRELLKSQGEVFKMKIAEIQRQCDANKRHVANVESKVDKAHPL